MVVVEVTGVALALRVVLFVVFFGTVPPVFEFCVELLDVFVCVFSLRSCWAMMHLHNSSCTWAHCLSADGTISASLLRRFLMCLARFDHLFGGSMFAKFIKLPIFCRQIASSCVASESSNNNCDFGINRFALSSSNFFCKFFLRCTRLSLVTNEPLTFSSYSISSSSKPSASSNCHCTLSMVVVMLLTVYGM